MNKRQAMHGIKKRLLIEERENEAAFQERATEAEIISHLYGACVDIGQRFRDRLPWLLILGI